MAIEITDEMVEAFVSFGVDESEFLLADTRAGLAAVLAIVERDHDVAVKEPRVPHYEVSGSFKWNPAAEEWMSKCICGEEFGGVNPAEVDERVLIHLERQL